MVLILWGLLSWPALLESIAAFLNRKVRKLLTPTEALAALEGCFRRLATEVEKRPRA